MAKQQHGSKYLQKLLARASPDFVGFAIDESIGQFGQPGFLIQGFIATHQGIEDKPAQGDGRRTQPEAGGQQ